MWGKVEDHKCFKALNGMKRSEYLKNECGDIMETGLEGKGFLGLQVKTTFRALYSNLITKAYPVL